MASYSSLQQRSLSEQVRIFLHDGTLMKLTSAMQA